MMMSNQSAGRVPGLLGPLDGDGCCCQAVANEVYVFNAD